MVSSSFSSENKLPFSICLLTLLLLRKSLSSGLFIQEEFTWGCEYKKRDNCPSCGQVSIPGSILKVNMGYGRYFGDGAWTSPYMDRWVDSIDEEL